MTDPQIVTHDGVRGVFVPAGGPAGVWAVALGRFMESAPAGVGVDRQIVAARRLLMLAEEAGSVPDDGEVSASGQVEGVPALEYMSVADAALRLGESPRTVRRRIARGEIPAVRTGRDHLIPIDALPGLEDEEAA